MKNPAALDIPGLRGARNPHVFQYIPVAARRAPPACRRSRRIFSLTLTPRRQATGFTLVEVLVVLVILGVALAMIGVNFAPDPRQSLDTEARRLVLLLQQARDEAMSTGSSIAFSAKSRQYRFWQRQAGSEGNAGHWQAHPDSELFRPRSLPEGISVSEVRVNRQPVEDEAQKIIFTPSGMMLPFRLTLTSGAHHLAITGNGTGEIRVE